MDWTGTILIAYSVVILGTSIGGVFWAFRTAKRNTRGLCARCEGALPSDEYDEVVQRRICLGCSAAERRRWLGLIGAGLLVFGAGGLYMLGRVIESLLERSLDENALIAATVSLGAGCYPLVRLWRNTRRPVANRADPSVTPSGVPKALADGQAADWERQAIRQLPGTTKR